jgi:hypothetical protein
MLAGLFSQKVKIEDQIVHYRYSVFLLSARLDAGKNLSSFFDITVRPKPDLYRSNRHQL